MEHATTITVNANLHIYGDYTQDELFNILGSFDLQRIMNEDGSVRATLVLTKAEAHHYINH